MGEALVISPEKRAFIRGGLAVEHTEKAEPAQLDVASAGEDGSAGAAAFRRSAHPPRHEDVRPREERQADPVEQPLLPLTTRLRSETADALRRAHLEQRLMRRKPDTVQEIVEEGVAQLLREMGYLR